MFGQPFEIAINLLNNFFFQALNQQSESYNSAAYLERFLQVIRTTFHDLCQCVTNNAVPFHYNDQNWVNWVNR